MRTVVPDRLERAPALTALSVLAFARAWRHGGLRRRPHLWLATIAVTNLESIGSLVRWQVFIPTYFHSHLVDAIDTLQTYALTFADANRLPALRAAARGLLCAGDGSSFKVQLLGFDDTQFTADAFAAWHIDCPDSVARSVRKRQAEYFFGRLAARRALADVGLEGAAADIPIGASCEPCWPPGIIGSISHTRHLAAAVALSQSVHRGVGIDLEQVVDAQGRATLLNTVVDAAELALLQSLASDNSAMDVLLTVVFSAKESLFKGAFATVGRYFDFSAARVVAIDPVEGRLQLCLTQTLCPLFVAGQGYDVDFRRVNADTVITCFAW